MLLSDGSIKKLLKEGRLVIQPKPILKSASIRLHLSNQFSKPGGKLEIKNEYLSIRASNFVILKNPYTDILFEVIHREYEENQLF